VTRNRLGSTLPSADRTGLYMEAALVLEAARMLVLALAQVLESLLALLAQALGSLSNSAHMLAELKVQKSDKVSAYMRGTVLELEARRWDQGSVRTMAYKRGTALGMALVLSMGPMMAWRLVYWSAPQGQACTSRNRRCHILGRKGRLRRSDCH
jgi:hypothetical protein